LCALRLIHKYLSLTMAVLWLLQAATGVLLVFHWELDDWTVSGPRKSLNPEKLGVLSRPSLSDTRPPSSTIGTVRSVWRWRCPRSCWCSPGSCELSTIPWLHISRQCDHLRRGPRRRANRGSNRQLSRM